MTNPTVLFEQQGAIGRLIFNRPEAMNTYDKKMSQDFPDAVANIEKAQHLKVLLLEGRGPAFMAGGDVRYFGEHLTTMKDQVVPLARLLHGAISDLRALSVPVIAKVHGAVAGAGLSIMLASDLVIASEETVFSVAYTQLGLSADGGCTYFLPRLVGLKKAMELMLFSERFDAKAALDLGLVNWIVSGDALEQKTQALLQILVDGPSEAYRGIKSLLRASFDNSLESQLELEAKMIGQMAKTENFKRGVQAFLQGKVPEFIDS